MIIDHQANKITFTEPKTFKNKKDTVKVDTENHWLLLNKDVVLYANPVEFTITKEGITITYEDATGNEYTLTPEGTGLEFLEVQDTHDHRQAVSILVGECLSLLADPDSKSTSECSCRQLHARIQELESQINPDVLSVYDINLAELSITELLGGVSGTTVGGGTIKIGLYQGYDESAVSRIQNMISVVSVEINDNAVNVSSSNVGHGTTGTAMSINTSFSTTYNDTPIPVRVTIKNNQTNKEYTITDSISVENGNLVLNGGGAVVTNYGAEWNVRVQPSNDSPLVLTLDLHTSKMINNLDTVGANSLVAFKLNNEAIPISQARASLSDYGAGYTITIPSSELAEGDNVFTCQILESDDTYPVTLEYTYNTNGGGS